MIATIYKHGSFVFFIYACVSLLLGLFGLSDLAVPEFWKSFSIVAFEVFAGAGVAVLFIDRFNAHRAQENLKHRLIREAGSRSHDVAISAVEWIDREGWLTGEEGLLKGANLQEAQLQGAWIDGANMEGALLRKADLRGAKLEGAWLRTAQMPEARLYRARLRGAKMQHAYLGSAYAERADFSHTCLKCATLDFMCLRDANLNDACLAKASMKQAKLHGAALIGADLSGAILIAAKLKNALYLNQAKWENAKLRYVDLQGVDFSDANMEGADLECANLEEADLCGTNLQGANLLGANLRGAKINQFDPPEESIFDMPGFEDGPVYSMGESSKTNLIGATLPNGEIFSVDMDFSYLRKFTDPSVEMCQALHRYCNRP